MAVVGGRLEFAFGRGGDAYAWGCEYNEQLETAAGRISVAGVGERERRTSVWLWDRWPTDAASASVHR